MDCAFRATILERLKHRNEICGQFEAIFSSYSELTDYVAQLTRTGRLRLTSVNEEIEGNDAELRAELSLLYRKKEQNDQQLIETNNRLEALQKKFDDLQTKYDSVVVEAEKLRKELDATMEENLALADANRLTKHEHLALQITYENLAQKFQVVERENDGLITQLKEVKEQQIRFLNDQNEKEERERHRARQAEILSSVENSPPSSDEKFEIIEGLEESQEANFLGDILPVKNVLKFECSEGEISDVCWFPTGQSFAAGGTDRKVRLYEVVNGKQEKKATLTGMNGSVMRLDLDAEKRQILAAGADFAIRVWGVDDLRARHSLTGHSDKVATAKFHPGGAKVISGSHDRTIRIWDLSTRKCYKTLFPGSTVFDLVPNPQFNAMVISAHYDKRVRVWDVTAEEPIRLIDLGGRVTSLALSSENQLVLCSSRDETLSLIDLRIGGTVHVYSSEQYRSSYDYSRCTLSPGFEYCAAGSADGQIFIWNIRTTKLEKVLSGGHDHAVTSVAWHPRGHALLSADRMKIVCLWSS